MIISDLTPICRISSSDTYAFIEKIGNRINKTFETSTRMQKPSENFQNGIKKNFSISLPNIHSIKFSNGNERSADILNADVLSERLDTICSGESLIKYYYFESNKNNSEENKCIAFWKTIMARKDLKPVECLFRVNDLDLSANSEKRIKKVPEIKNELNMMSYTNEETEEHFWYNTLLEMKKRNMDQLALSAIRPTCKFCDSETKYNKNYSEEELNDNEDIISLNKWKPKSVRKRQKRHLAAVYGKQSTKNNIANINSGETLHKCTCRKDQCKCSFAKKKQVETAILLREIETATTQDVKPVIESITVKGKTPQAVTTVEKRIEQLLPLKNNNNTIFSEVLQIEAPTVTTQKYEQTSIINIIEPRKIRCEVCGKMRCSCKEYFDEEAKKFIDKVRHELHYIQKDKSCVTIERSLKFPYCLVCEDTDRCAKTHKKLKVVNVPHKEDVYLKTIFESKPEDCVHSTTMVPQVKRKKKSTAFSFAGTSSRKEKSNASSTRIISAKIKSDNNREPKIKSSIKINRDKSIEQSIASKTTKRTLLWYSSEISNDK